MIIKGPLDEATLAQYQQQFAQASRPTPKKKQQGKGGPLSAFISEAGGTGGALGGAAIGTAIMPGIGTLAGALIGGFAGGTAGRAAENKIRDNQNFLGEGGSAKASLTEGAISGVMGAGPLRLAGLGKNIVTKGASNTVGSLANALVKPVAADGGQAVAGQVMNAPLKTSITGKLESWGNNQLAKQWGTLDKPTIRATSPTKTVGSLADMGIVKPQDAERIASGLTGSNGVVNRAVVSAVGGASKVPTTGVGSVLDRAIAENGLVDKDASSVRQVIEAQLGKLGGNSHANPTQVMGVMKSIEKRIADLGGKGGNYKMATPERLDQAKALQAVHKELEDSLYKAAGADVNVSKVLTPELRKQLIDLHPNNPQWASHIDNNIMTAKTVGNLRSAQSPFVKARQMIDNADENSFSVGGKLGNALNAGGIKSAIANTATNFAKDPALRLAGTTARKLAGTNSGAAQSLVGALTVPTKTGIVRNELIGSQLNGMTRPQDAEASAFDTEQQGLATMEQPQAEAIGADEWATLSPEEQQLQMQTFEQTGFTTDGRTIGEDTTNGGGKTSSSLLDPANLESNIEQMLTQGASMKDIKEYMSLVADMQAIRETTGGGKKDKLSSTTASSLASSANGTNTLNQLEQLFGQAGGGSGRIGGKVSNVMSKVGMNDNAQIYNDLAGSSVSQLAKALNGGGQVSDTDATVIIQALPKITDSPAAARAKFADLKSRLRVAQQNTLRFGGEADDQADLLTALGG